MKSPTVAALVLLVATLPVALVFGTNIETIAESIRPFEVPTDSELQSQLPSFNASRRWDHETRYFGTIPFQESTIEDVREFHRRDYERNVLSETKEAVSLAGAVVLSIWLGCIGIILARQLFFWCRDLGIFRGLLKFGSSGVALIGSTRNSRRLEALNAEFARAEMLYAKRLISEQDLEAVRIKIQRAIEQNGLLNR